MIKICDTIFLSHFQNIYFIKIRNTYSPFLKSIELYVSANRLNAELIPICYLLVLLGAHPILHVSKIRVKRIKVTHYFF